MPIRFNLRHASASALVLLAEPSSVVVAFAPASSSYCSSPATSTTTPTSIVARRQQRRYHSSLNPDWDNNDFLSSLGGPPDSINDANDKYYQQKENRAAMDAWRMKQLQQQQQGQREQPPPPTTTQPPASTSMQQNGPSPEFFKKMGLGEGQVPQPPPPRPMIQPPPPQFQQPPPPQAAQFYDANGNPITMPMIYDAYGNLVPFNPMQSQQQQLSQQPAQPNTFYPPLPPKTKATPDKSQAPMGYNPDAFTMANTADVYFAQLKQDSKVRKLARMSGDIETANKVFADETVKQIGDSWTSNPYTKEKNIAEARAEIEGAVRMQVAGEFYESDSDSHSSTSASFANSYKVKLEQIKAARQQQQQAATAVVPPATMQPPPVKEIMPASVRPVAASTVEVPEKIDVQSFQPNAGMTSSTSPAQVKVGISVPPKIASSVTLATAAAPAPSSATDDEENVRRSIRTAQGLILKHRGGPGFGAGRLKAPEAQRLEDTLQNVKSILRAEVGGGGSAVPATSTVKVEARPVVTQPIMPPPIQPKPSVTTIPPPVTTMAPSMTNDPLAGSVACVEAVLKMYKESSPAEREAMIIPLREAFMAAASASNKYIAESELGAHRAAMEAGPVAAFASMENNPPASPIMGFPTTYAVTNPQEEEKEVMVMANTGGKAADNVKQLEDVYNALQNARGDGGKLGLKNISGDEANALADKLVMMRGVLLDELNN